MASAGSSRSSAPVLFRSGFNLQRSLSPTRHFYSSYSTPPSSSALDFSVHRSLASHRSSASVNFSLDRSVSPNRNLQARSPGRSVPPKVCKPKTTVSSGSGRKTCMCSPTNHPGSFRCNLHRNQPSSSSSGSTNSQLNMRRSAMKNSLVRIGSVEGDWLKRSLAALIRPSNHQLKRRSSYQPQPSRLRHMTRAQNVDVC